MWDGDGSILQLSLLALSKVGFSCREQKILKILSARNLKFSFRESKSLNRGQATSSHVLYSSLARVVYHMKHGFCQNYLRRSMQCGLGMYAKKRSIHILSSHEKV